MLRTEQVGCFNPFKMPAFFCPVCGGHKFVELFPHAGVWCEKCNSQFEVKGTCDGKRKLAISCKTDSLHTEPYFKKPDFVAPLYYTVIWQDDDEVVWHARTEDRQLKFVSLVNGLIVVTD